MQKPLYQCQHYSHIIRHFTPNWFTVNMGTGVVALGLSTLPFFPTLLWSIASGLWLANSLLFLIFLSLYALRWLCFYKEAKLILQHNSMLFFLGAIPMALATIINGMIKYGVPLFGPNMLTWAQGLWYLDAFLALACAIFVPAIMFSRQRHQLHHMTAIWLLPIVAAEVAACSGGMLLGNGIAAEQAPSILIMSYMLWGFSVLPALAILSILFLRLALHQLPEQHLAISSFLALGPIGTGALALLLIGKNAALAFTDPHFMILSQSMQYGGIIAATVLIGFGCWWLAIALFTLYQHRGLGFNLGWWGLTFPLGVYTLAILELAQQLQLHWLGQIGTLFLIGLLGIWAIVCSKTMAGAYRGELFHSPCLLAAQQPRLTSTASELGRV